jgi:Protein of unknown function (DUF3313)
MAGSAGHPGRGPKAAHAPTSDPDHPMGAGHGEGASFGDLSEVKVQQIGEMFVAETRSALGTKYSMVPQSGPGVARLRFTIIGVTETVPYVSTATRVIPIGAAINLLSQGAGRGGTLTGSVTYGMEALFAVRRAGRRGGQAADARCLRYRLHARNDGHGPGRRQGRGGEAARDARRPSPVVPAKARPLVPPLPRRVPRGVRRSGPNRGRKRTLHHQRETAAGTKK